MKRPRRRLTKKAKRDRCRTFVRAAKSQARKITRRIVKDKALLIKVKKRLIRIEKGCP